MLHLPFEDRVEAGRLLAKELSARHIPQLDKAVVLALTRGGVPVGFEVADRLHLPLDIIVARKLGVPWQPELAMGAIANGTRILDNRIIEELGIPQSEVDETIARETAEMNRRKALYRGGAPPLDLQDRPAILVDDGLATGNTMLAAVGYARTLKPSRILIAVPVGSKDACQRLRREVDDLVCLATPEMFFAVGEWYRDFEQVNDEQVRHLLAESHEQFRKHPAPATAA